MAVSRCWLVGLFTLCDLLAACDSFVTPGGDDLPKTCNGSYNNYKMGLDNLNDVHSKYLQPFAHDSDKIDRAKTGPRSLRAPGCASAANKSCRHRRRRRRWCRCCFRGPFCRHHAPAPPM